MKLKYEFETMQMDDEIVAVPVGEGAEEFRGVLKLNDSATFILNTLKDDVTQEEIVEKILKEYEGDRAEITEFVKDYIGTLQEQNLLA